MQCFAQGTVIAVDNSNRTAPAVTITVANGYPEPDVPFIASAAEAKVIFFSAGRAFQAGQPGADGMQSHTRVGDRQWRVTLPPLNGGFLPAVGALVGADHAIADAAVAAAAAACATAGPPLRSIPGFGLLFGRTPVRHPLASAIVPRRVVHASPLYASC